MKQVYISYPKAAREQAVVITERLERGGISCFIAPRDITGDIAYGKALIQAIQDCSLVLVVACDAINGAEQVMNEVDMAVNIRKPVLPVLVENFTMGDEFRYYLGRKQWVVAFPEPLDGYLDKIYERVAEKVEVLPPPAPKPVASSPAPAPAYVPVSDIAAPYVFVSYAHADSDRVLPLIAAMQKAGIRVWYDNGIEAGSEWPEYIAEKVHSCAKFMSLISPAYLASQNCKRELNFAISRQKELLSVYLEDVVLSLGMEMQLGTYQAIFRNRFETQEAFVSCLCGERFFQPCRD